MAESFSRTPKNEAATPALLSRAAPAVFVLLWSTGFIGARGVLPDSEPFTVLALRFACTVAVLLPLALLLRARWPTRLGEISHLAVVGLLVHGAYLGGVFSAIEGGMPAGLAALITGLQPILTALLAGPIRGERTAGRQWLGLILGLVGVALVVSEKLADPAQSGAAQGLVQGFGLGALAAAGVAVAGISAGTLYQKRFCQGVDLVSASVIQFAAAGVLMAGLCLALETREIAWTPEFLLGFGWLVGGLSLGAVTLLLFLIRRGAAAGVASLFYLVPPVTALLAHLFYGETLGPLALVGMAVAVVGVALVVARQPRRG